MTKEEIIEQLKDLAYEAAEDDFDIMTAEPEWDEDEDTRKGGYYRYFNQKGETFVDSTIFDLDGVQMDFCMNVYYTAHLSWDGELKGFSGDCEVFYYDPDNNEYKMSLSF